MVNSETPSHQGPGPAAPHSPESAGEGACKPIVVVRGGIAEAVDGADVVIVDCDITELDTPSIRAEDREGMEDRRAEVLEAGGPRWLLAEIDECIEDLSADPGGSNVEL